MAEWTWDGVEYIRVDRYSHERQSRVEKRVYYKNSATVGEAIDYGPWGPYRDNNSLSHSFSSTSTFSTCSSSSSTCLVEHNNYAVLTDSVPDSISTEEVGQLIDEYEKLKMSQQGPERKDEACHSELLESDIPGLITDLDFRQINRELKHFLMHGAVTDFLDFQPMDSTGRKYISELASQYQMQVHAYGSSKADKRFVRVTKTINSRLPSKFSTIDKLIVQANNAMKWSDKTIKGHRRWDCFSMDQRKEKMLKQQKKLERQARKQDSKRIKKNQRRKTKDTKNNATDNDSKESPSNNTAKPKPGTVVGSHASPLDESNKGMQLLKKLGWSPGVTLGTSTASTASINPIEAIVRSKRKGL